MTTTLLADVLAIVVALTTSAEPARQIPVPFSIGERLEYDVKFGVLKVGNGKMEVLGIETIRGREAWHTAFTVKGGTFFYKVNDRLESWIDVETFASLRHVQDLQEGKRDRERRFEIYPDRLVYTENESEERPTARDPLDDGSFLYFIRTVPLSVGQTYDFPRYFKPDRNPVRVRVLRKESVKVPAGRFDAIVIQPIIKSKGIFSENGQAEIWLSDDDRRIMLQMKSNLSFGTLNLYLKSYTAGTATAAK
ncbi:MAG TPA: DUF3108 domain-containing protein [Gemmatimonadaceae bacterium]|nr:DUF3108 domain-containing protein [Gemmatimonadaceae bacterium]